MLTLLQFEMLIYLSIQLCGHAQLFHAVGGTTNGPGPRIRGGPGSVGNPLLF
jgi:hypothetical protein